MRLASLLLFAALFTVPTLAQDNPVTDGIALWLRADAGVTLDALGRVAAWQDQSDDAYVFGHVDGVPEDRRPLLGKGILNGQDVVRFDGVNDYLTGGDILDDVFVGDGAQFTLFTLISPKGSTVDDGVFFGKNADSSFNPSEDQRQILYSIDGGKAQIAPYFALCCNPFPPVRVVDSESTIVDTTLVLTFEYDGTQAGNDGLDRIGMRFNGDPEPVSLEISYGALGNIQNGAAPLAVGARVNTAGTVANLNFLGDIAEVILYDRLLTANELQQVETYLGEKFGLNSPNFALTMTPTAPLTVPPGGQVSFDYTIANNTAATATGDFYFIARRNGTPVAQGIVRSGSLPGGQTVQSNTTIGVPGAAPPGDYELTFSIGNAFSQSVDDVTYTVTVQGAAREGGATWEVTEASPWTPVEDASANAALPETVMLEAPYPNPASARATISFALPEAGPVRLAVYDVLGREVAVLAEGMREAGTHTAVFDARALAGGLYLVRLEASGTVQTRRLTLVR